MGITRKQLIMLAILASGTFVTILNQTLVSPALPSIMIEQNVDAATVQWLTTGFTLMNAVMIPVTAWLIDRFSTRSLFICAMSFFTVGSALCAWGLNFPILLIGRLVQAMGAGVLMPMAMTVLLLTFPVERRGVAMGWFGVIISFAPAIGPTLGGVLVDNFDWHIMFMMVTVLSIIDVVCAVLFLTHVKQGSKDVAKLDKLSVLLSSVGFGTLLFGFSSIGSYGISAISLVAVLIGAVVVALFFRRQVKLENPMLHVEVLKNRRFLAGTLAPMLVQMAIMANAVLMPIFVQDICGQSATVTGLIMLPGAIVMGIMGPVAGKIFDKRGPRIMGLVGTGLLTVATIVFCFLGSDTSMIFLCVLITTRNFAMSLINMPITTWGMNSLDNRLVPHGNAVNNTLRQVSGSLGTAIVVSVYALVVSGNSATMGSVEAGMLGINISFAVQTIFCLAAFIMVIVMVKDKHEDVVASDPNNERKDVVEAIMHRDVFTVPVDAKVSDAVSLFIEKGISAAPIVDENNRLAGVISDGDIVRALSTRDQSYMGAVAAILSTGATEESNIIYRLDTIMDQNVLTYGTSKVITVDIHMSVEEICRIMGENHLKKVPVMDGSQVVGVINRSDITLASMKVYVDRRQRAKA